MRGLIELLRTPFSAQRETIEALLGLPNTRRLAIDATGLGEQLAEELAARFGARVEPVKFSVESKNDLAGNLRIRVEDRSVRIAVDADIRNDWHSIERQVLPGGTVRYAADRGAGGTPGHADRFWAAALGVRAAGGGGTIPLELHVGRAAEAAGSWL